MSSAHTRWQARPFLDVDGRELVRVVQNEVGLERELRLVVVRNNQLVLADSVERFRSAVEYLDGSVVLLRPDVRTPDGVVRSSWASRRNRWPVINSARSLRVLGREDRAHLGERHVQFPQPVDHLRGRDLLTGVVVVAA